MLALQLLPGTSFLTHDHEPLDKDRSALSLECAGNLLDFAYKGVRRSRVWPSFGWYVVFYIKSFSCFAVRFATP
jgi:hypothetical protein